MDFDKFKGMQAERKIRIRKPAKLECLLGFAEKFKNSRIDREGLYSFLSKELPQFDKNDLVYCIFSLMNRNFCDEEAFVIGRYTGCLLQILTERNYEKGKRTKIYLDGKNNRFNCLFCEAKQIDELIIENLKGNYVCADICDEGKAGLVAGINIRGYYNFSDMANKGQINRIVGLDIRGDGCFCNIGDGGAIGCLIASNITGKNNLCNIIEKGSVQIIVARNIIGESALHDVAMSGYASCIIGSNMESNDGFVRMVQDGGSIGLIALSNIKGNDSFCDIGKGGDDGMTDGPRVKRIMYDRVRGKDSNNSVFAEEVISGEKFPKEYEKMMKKYRIKEILDLADLLVMKRGKQIIPIVNKIQAINRKIGRDYW